MVLDIEIEGTGTRLEECRINEKMVSAPWLGSEGQGRQSIVLKVGKG
jgi:hypothetical protein